MNVLIVDSVPANRKLLKESLHAVQLHAVVEENAVMHIETAESISHSIKRLNHENFDLALVSTSLVDGPIRRFLDEARRVHRAVPPIIVYTIVESQNQIVPPADDLLEAGAYDVIEASVDDTEAFKTLAHKAIAQAVKHTRAQPPSRDASIQSANPTAERTKNETLRLYEIVLNYTGEAILLFDATGSITFANEAAAEVYNTTPGAMVGLNITNLIDSTRHRVARDMLNSVLPLSGNKRVRFQRRGELEQFDASQRSDESPTNSPSLPARGYAIRHDGAEMEVHFEARNLEIEQDQHGGMMRMKPAGRIQSTGQRPSFSAGDHLSLISRSENDRFLQREVPNRPRFTQVMDIIASQTRIEETRFLLAMAKFSANTETAEEVLVWESLSDELNSILSTTSEIYQYGCWDLDTLAVCALANTDESVNRITDSIAEAAALLCSHNDGLRMFVGVAIANDIPSTNAATKIAYELVTQAKEDKNSNEPVEMKIELM